MPKAKIRLIARFQSGDTTAKTIRIDPSDGDALNHLTLGFPVDRTSFCMMDRTISVDTDSESDCYSAARQAVEETLPGVFTLDTADVFGGQAHYWNGERWVKLAAGQGFGFGFAIWKNGTAYSDKVRVNAVQPNPGVALKVEYIVSIFDANLS